MRSFLIHLIFLLSGVSGLVYEVLWVRTLGHVFGGTLHSAALVTGVFVAGLGLGAWLLGRWADRVDQPRKVVARYALLELSIGVMAVCLAHVFPRLVAITPYVTAYGSLPEGWLGLTAGTYVIRCLVAGLFLLPITVLMGGTLTLLIRALVDTNTRNAGLRVAALYGVNTAGAAVGSYLTDVALVPWLGIVGTQLFAASLNAAAGAGALAVAMTMRSAPVKDTRDDHNGAQITRHPNDIGARLWPGVALALALFGAAGMGMEIVWFRFLSNVFGQQRIVFSTLLAIVLTGIWTGSIASGFLQRRLGATRLLLLSSPLFVLSTLLLLLAYAAGRQEGFFGQGCVQDSLFVLGLPSFFLGVNYPAANAITQTLVGAVGRRAGYLYLGTAGGNIVGAVLTGFLLIPALGVHVAAIDLCGCLLLEPCFSLP